MDPLETLKEAHYTNGVVLGLKDVTDVQPRKDIDKFLVEDPDAFNLFLLALDKLQSEDMLKERMGFFEIAGKSRFVC